MSAEESNIRIPAWEMWQRVDGKLDDLSTKIDIKVEALYLAINAKAGVEDFRKLREDVDLLMLDRETRQTLESAKERRTEWRRWVVPTFISIGGFTLGYLLPALGVIRTH